MSLVKGVVVGGSSSDPAGMGRVEVRSSGLWDRSLRIPVVGNVALNEGDCVFVDISCGVESPLVLGRSRDGLWDVHGGVTSGGSLLWDSADVDGSWCAAWVCGGVLRIENSEGLCLRCDGRLFSVHDGKNGGVVNVSSLIGFMKAVLSDLASRGMGSATAGWFSSSDGYASLVDETFRH